MSEKFRLDRKIGFRNTFYTKCTNVIIDSIGPSIILRSIVFPETTRPIELKFHMRTPYDWLAKIYTNCYGHMTKMATTPIYAKNSLNIFFSGTKRQWPWDLVCSIRDVGPIRFAQMVNIG